MILCVRENKVTVLVCLTTNYGLMEFLLTTVVCIFQNDVFTLKAVELGRLKKVKVRHDNKGGGAAWFLGHVEITDPKARET